MGSVKKAFSVLSKKKRWKLAWLIIVILIGSLMELAGVTAILPFINVALAPESIFENQIMLFIYEQLGLNKPEEFLVILGLVLIAIYVLKNIYIILMNNYIYKFAYQNQKELACRLLTSYLKQPYSFFAKHNSADFIRNLNEDTIYFFETVIASLQFVAEIMVCVMLGTTLLVMDITLTLGMVTILVLFVLTVFRMLKRNLEKRIRVMGLERYFGHIIVPTESITEIKGGKRKVIRQKLYPGYVIIEMEINDDSWYLVRQTSGIGDFAGANGKPITMLPEEVERILQLSEQETEKSDGKSDLRIAFAIGDSVKVTEGTFMNYEGVVDSIDTINGRVTVMISYFGRSTPVELEYWQVESL